MHHNTLFKQLIGCFFENGCLSGCLAVKLIAPGEGSASKPGQCLILANLENILPLLICVFDLVCLLNVPVDLVAKKNLTN